MELILSGTIDPGFSCFPTLIDYQKVQAGEDKTVLFTITYNKSLLPKKFTPTITSKDASVHIKEVHDNRNIKSLSETTNNDIVMHTYQLTVNKKQIGSFTGSIDILSVDNNETIPAISLPLYGEVTGSLTADPGSLRFDLNKNDISKQTVTITALSSVNCNKLRVYSDNIAVSAVLQGPIENANNAKDYNELKLYIAIRRDILKTKLKANITLLSDNGQKLILPVYVNVK